MSLTDFHGLKAEIADHLDHDLADKAETFIQLAESRHRGEIRIRDMVRRAQAVFSTRYLALPEDFVQMHNLRLLNNPIHIVYEVSVHELNLRRSDKEGTPQFFAIHRELEFERPPDEEYTAEMLYWGEIEPLSEDNPTNALLKRSPGVYLYAALVAAEPYMMHDERIKTWDTLYVNARDQLLAIDRAGRGGGPLFSRVSGATP